MAIVAGRNRVNRPYFFTSPDGSRVEIPSFGFGQGELDANQLALFEMYVASKQIEAADTEPPNAFTNSMWSVAGGAGKFTVTITALPDDTGIPITGIAILVDSLDAAVVDPETGTYEIDDIPAGTYDISMVAISDGGDSVASPAKSVTVA